MIPVSLDAGLPLALAGRGPAAARRVAQLLDGGAEHLAVYSDRPDDRLARLAGESLRPRLPRPADLAGLAALWLVGLDRAEAEHLRSLARPAGILVNVEDVPALCDFHSPALVRRGDLLLTVSTGGRSPRLAARIRAFLAARFGPDWAARVAEAAAAREDGRRNGAGPEALSLATDRLIDQNGWLA